MSCKITLVEPILIETLDESLCRDFGPSRSAPLSSSSYCGISMTLVIGRIVTRMVFGGSLFRLMQMMITIPMTSSTKIAADRPIIMGVLSEASWITCGGVSSVTYI